MPLRTIRGATLSYAEQGAGSALILLHAFPLDGRMWKRQVEALSDSARVIVPDARGFGRSKSGDGGSPLSMESLADDVHALAGELNAAPFVLGGLSMGGYVALAYARKYPDTLRGLILADTKADADTPDAKLGREKMIELARSEGSAAVAEQMLPKLLAEHSAKHKPAIVKEVREMAEATSPETLAAALAALRDRPDQTAMLGTIRVPTLVIVGDADSLTPPAAAEKLWRAIPHAQLALIQGAGHLSAMEQPEQVNAAMRKFLQSLT